MNEVIAGILIGGYPAKEDVKVLHCLGVASILTIGICQLSGDFDSFRTKFLHLRDEPTEDMLSLIEEALSFVDESRRIGKVLIHCSAGISRSPAVVIAYLMRQERLSYEEAFTEISKQRSVCPNVGFINQLKLFHAMGWQVDTNSAPYKRFVAIRKFRGASSSEIPSLICLIDEDAYGLHPINSSFKSQDATPVAFRCRKCRYQLFTSSNLVRHCKPPTPGADSELDLLETDQIASDAVLLKGVTWNSGQMLCDSDEIFSEPLDWTRSTTHEVEGKIYCPKCSSKIGSFNWCGVQCACGSWVTPAFHFSQGRVDRITPKGRPCQVMDATSSDRATTLTDQESLKPDTD